MGLVRRSDASRRRVGGLVLALAGGWLLAGCELFPSLDDVVAPELKYEEANLTPQALDERTKEIDTSYAEPRTPTKVQLSYETSLVSISRVNNYEALWRGARACAWLAFNHPTRSARKEYATKGVEFGRAATKRLSPSRY